MQTDEQAEEEHNADKVDEDEGGLDRDAQAAEKQAAKEPEDKQGKGQGKLTDKEGRASGACSSAACMLLPMGMVWARPNSRPPRSRRTSRARPRGKLTDKEGHASGARLVCDLDADCRLCTSQSRARACSQGSWCHRCVSHGCNGTARGLLDILTSCPGQHISGWSEVSDEDKGKLSSMQAPTSALLLVGVQQIRADCNKAA